MPAHDVIDAQHAGALQMMTQAVDVIAIALGADRIGFERWKAPVLAFDKQPVGRRAAIDVESEQILIAPNVEAVAIDAEGKVEIERRRFSARMVAQSGGLLRAEPLDIEMVIFT